VVRGNKWRIIFSLHAVGADNTIISASASASTIFLELASSSTASPDSGLAVSASALVEFDVEEVEAPFKYYCSLKNLSHYRSRCHSLLNPPHDQGYVGESLRNQTQSQSPIKEEIHCHCHLSLMFVLVVDWLRWLRSSMLNEVDGNNY
jgi:hypothetical protein